MKLVRLATIIIVVTLAVMQVSAQSASTIRIADFGIDAQISPVYVREFPNGAVTWDVAGLNMTAGILDGLTQPGQPGNTVVVAHSLNPQGTPDLFFNLASTEIGQTIEIEANGQVYIYSVTEVYTVSEYDLTPVYPTSDERLTLITCDTNSLNSATGQYDQRIVVVASRVL